MDTINTFNVRVYAFAIRDKKTLVLHEEYAGENLIKLPGGGLEFGEGIIDCLHREFEEELNCKISIVRHIYTQEEFQKSRFKSNEQLLTVYYEVQIIDENEFIIMDPCIEKTEWIEIDSNNNPFQLPIDRIAFDKLREIYRDE